ncbi:HAD superfamily- subfamily IIIB acid phosphatase [Striga hermonthica]|uniref:HAD superfamily- subfamily IIIB acid phosphatase n=1 Tax=Striga hermonthica TaxID=68872 RepID=A0A9N7NJ00_STRHE|nr:HAD superfamily- subfamily IIIB acid phosphatase [Striga hermonthica]
MFGVMLLVLVFGESCCCCRPTAAAFRWTRAPPPSSRPPVPAPADWCLSWRLGVETNNIRGWPTVPWECLLHVKYYMEGAQYNSDTWEAVQSIIKYAININISTDGLDAWVLDVDDTCISNLPYYRNVKNYGVLPYDPVAFQKWALQSECPVIANVRDLFNILIGRGFKVFLVTGRSEDTFRNATIKNLQNQGFFGYEKLILRDKSYRGQSAITFKSAVRRQLVEDGYRIVGNVGDQWSDLMGDALGNRTFKLPNPMYFVP